MLDFEKHLSFAIQRFNDAKEAMRDDPANIIDEKGNKDCRISVPGL